MQVEEAEDGMRVELDHAYIIPPNKDMAILNDTFIRWGLLYHWMILDRGIRRFPVCYTCPLMC